MVDYEDFQIVYPRIENLHRHNSELVPLTKQSQIRLNEKHVFTFNINRSVLGRDYLAIDVVFIISPANLIHKIILISKHLSFTI